MVPESKASLAIVTPCTVTDVREEHPLKWLPFILEMITLYFASISNIFVLAAMTSLSIALDPPMTLGFGAIFLRHSLNPYILPGVFLIAIGIIVSSFAKQAAAVPGGGAAIAPAIARFAAADAVSRQTSGSAHHHRVATSEEHEA